MISKQEAQEHLTALNKLKKINLRSPYWVNTIDKLKEFVKQSLKEGDTLG